MQENHLKDLKNDFGIEIEDDLYGIDISDLKTVGLSDLPKAIQEKVQNQVKQQMDANQKAKQPKK